MHCCNTGLLPRQTPKTTPSSSNLPNYTYSMWNFRSNQLFRLLSWPQILPAKHHKCFLPHCTNLWISTNKRFHLQFCPSPEECSPTAVPLQGGEDHVPNITPTPIYPLLWSESVTGFTAEVYHFSLTEGKRPDFSFNTLLSFFCFFRVFFKTILWGDFNFMPKLKQWEDTSCAPCTEIIVIKDPFL